MFLDADAPRFHRDFDVAKHDVVALLRVASAQDPRARELIEILGTLTTQSEEFSSLWASHDVLRHRSGTKLLTHPGVGDLKFGYESFELSADPGLVMLVFTVEPGSATAEAVRRLGSWAAPSHCAQKAPGPAAEQQRRT
ncbi:hypothetical protein ACFVUW_00600 [Streptomyces xiamenensis]|uniref:MmyB family transcriptional regulator n=1 Tax=Streptomyces xiamenensis TaxID=408015 RepID=UPI0036EB8896